MAKSWLWQALLARYPDLTSAIMRLVAARGLLRAPPIVGLFGFVMSRLQPATVTAATATRLARIRLMVEVLSKGGSGRMVTTPHPPTDRTGGSKGTARGQRNTS